MHLVLIALLLAAAQMPEPSAAARIVADPVLGIWSNPKGTLAVRTAPCGTGLCGEIVRAAPQALADARDAGIAKLVGTQLLQDYHKAASGRWNGRVYVPDMGRTFSSHITQNAPDQLTIAGCLIGGFFCKSQVWHRIP